MLTVVGVVAGGFISGCSGSGGSSDRNRTARTPDHRAVVSNVASPAPTAPAGVSLAALRHMHWSALPADPLGPRELAVTAWTGSVLLMVGGAPVSGRGAALTGADTYDPQQRTWRLLPNFPLAARTTPASAWTGYGLVVWGGETNLGDETASTHALGDGAILDVTHQRWRVMPAGPLPALKGPVAVTDAADQVIILGGEFDEPARAGDGTPVISRLVASYNPANRHWRKLPPLPAVPHHDLVDVAAVRWGSRVLVSETWQHIVHPVPGGTEGSGGVDLFLLDPASGHWSTFRVPGSVPFRADLRPLGSSLVFGGGTGCPLWAACPAVLSSPFTMVDDHGRQLSGIPVPPIQLQAETSIADSYVVMTGSQIMGPGRDEQPGDAAAFDLATKRWVALPSARRFKPQPESLTWTGHELIAASPSGEIALGPT